MNIFFTTRIFAVKIGVAIWKIFAVKFRVLKLEHFYNSDFCYDRWDRTRIVNAEIALIAEAWFPNNRWNRWINFSAILSIPVFHSSESELYF